MALFTYCNLNLQIARALFKKMWIKKQHGFQKTSYFYLFAVVFCPMIHNIDLKHGLVLYLHV